MSWPFPPPLGDEQPEFAARGLKVVLVIYTVVVAGLGVYLLLNAG